LASLFGRQSDITFGPSRVSGRASCSAVIVRSPDEEALRDSVRSDCPQTSGVYGMFDDDGRWIYVGKSKRLRTRLLSYFRARTRAAKERRILDRTSGIAWEKSPSEFGALVRELELIQRWRPPFNVLGQPTSRLSTYLCVGRPPAPYLYLSDRPGKDARHWFGPLPDTRRAADAARRINDYFGLRDCPKEVELEFADQGKLFPVLRTPGCLRYELENCLGPCVAACTKEEYQRRVKKVRAYLSGDDATPIVELEKEIQAAIESLEFERAAGLHLLLGELRWILEHLGRLRVAKGEYSFVYPLRGVWYLIRGGVVVDAIGVPRDGQAAVKTKALLERVFKQSPDGQPRSGIRDLDMLLLVSSWFRKNPDHLERTMSVAKALAKLETAAKPATANRPAVLKRKRVVPLPPKDQTAKTA
jgi:excinuclease ABC subunit C